MFYTASRIKNVYKTIENLKIKCVKTTDEKLLFNSKIYILYPFIAPNKKLLGKVVTKISLLKNYCTAEEYHQKYLEKR